MEEKLRFIREKFDTEFTSSKRLIEVDFEFNLLLCAAQSYKHETVLKPFPSAFLNEQSNEQSHSKLVSALLSLPPVPFWKAKLETFNADQVSVIHTILSNKNYRLDYRHDMNQERLKELTQHTDKIQDPNYIFEIKYPEEKTKKFEGLKQDHNVSMAYHGSRFENFYSILNIGLLSHFNKTSVFGEGTYLSQEPSVSLHYSPSCKSWDKSIIGQRMSCMIVCEVITDPQHVKVAVKSEDTSVNDKKAANNVPEKYFIVQNNEYLRAKYVLLYSEKLNVKRTNRLKQFLFDNKFLLLLLSYATLLLFVGLMNSKSFHKYIKLSYQRLTSYFLLDEAASYE